jgi:hypothetical protein
MIFDKVKADLIKDKKTEVMLKKINDILNKNEKAVELVLKMPQTEQCTVSKSEILESKENSTTNAEAVLKHIPNVDTVISLLSTLSKGNVKHFALPNGDYLLVGISKVVKLETVNLKTLKTLEKYVDSTVEKEFPEIATNAFKQNMKIKIDEKGLNAVTKDVDSTEE